MSKMSQLHAELEQQAYEKGYESLDEALNDGATIIGGTLLTGDDIKYVGTKDAQEQAHEAWLKERGEVIKGLQEAQFFLNNLGAEDDVKNIEHAIQFIEQGEM